MDLKTALNVLNQVAAAMMGNLADHQNAQKALEVVKDALYPPPPPVDIHGVPEVGDSI